jgi:hypothetical protein
MTSDREQLQQIMDTLQYMLRQCARPERWPQSRAARVAMREHLEAALEPIYQGSQFTQEREARRNDLHRCRQHWQRIKNLEREIRANRRVPSGLA